MVGHIFFDIFEGQSCYVLTKGVFIKEAKFGASAGHIWPAGGMFCKPALDNHIKQLSRKYSLFFSLLEEDSVKLNKKVRKKRTLNPRCRSITLCYVEMTTA